MPQMAPLWWSLLFIMFLMSFMMMCIIMHFQNTQESNKMLETTPATQSMNWKW